MLTRLFEKTWIKLLLIGLFALVLTVPFAGQDFTLDEPLMIDYARMQMEAPLQQDLPEYDYFGIHFDNFFNTHPRLLSLYLSLVLRVAGAEPEIPVHLSLAIFPVIAGISMYYLARRFRVNGMVAALLLLSAPVFVISSHMAMVDVPGTSLWLAAITAFIYGVDRNRGYLLALAGILFTATIFTFYQGLSALGLALLYVLLRRRLSWRTFLPVIVPAGLFLAFLASFFATYGEPPRFSYRRSLPAYDRTIPRQLRAFLTALGGTALFPLALAAGSMRNWRAIAVYLLVTAGTLAYSIPAYLDGDHAIGTVILLSIFLPAGATAVYMVVETLIVHLPRSVRSGETGSGVVVLAIWVLGVLAYSVFLLGYPAPRYLLPAIPPLILILLVIWRSAAARMSRLWQGLMAAAVALALALSIGLSVAYMERATAARDIADWVEARYGDQDGNIWYNGELGFRYYMEQKGYRQLPNVIGVDNVYTEKDLPVASPEPGDLIAASPTFGNWYAFPDTLARMRLLDQDSYILDGPLVVYGISNQAAWGSSLLLPYNLNIETEEVESIIIWRVVAEPVPILEEVVEQLPESVARELTEDRVLRRGEEAGG